MGGALGFEPKEIIHKLRGEVDRNFEGVLGLTPSGLTTSLTHWRPRIDIYETDSHLVVEADLPGVTSSAIDLSITGRIMTLKAEPGKLDEEGFRDYHRRERYRKQWTRLVELPAEVDHGAIKATYGNGVLHVECLKKHPGMINSTRIPIT